MYRLRVLKSARNDMQESAAWFEKERMGLGMRFLQEVADTFDREEANPLHYQERYRKKFRFALVHDFPFLVAYKIKGRVVTINSVFHTSRNPTKFV